MARGDWLLFLSPASVLEAGWQGEALGFVDRAFMAGTARTSAATFRLRRAEAGMGARLAEAVASFRTRLLRRALWRAGAADLARASTARSAATATLRPWPTSTSPGGSAGGG